MQCTGVAVRAESEINVAGGNPVIVGRYAEEPQQHCERVAVEPAVDAEGLLRLSRR